MQDWKEINLPIGFIDPPGPFAPMKQLHNFLIFMESFPQDDPIVQSVIKSIHRSIEFRLQNPELERLLEERYGSQK